MVRQSARINRLDDISTHTVKTPVLHSLAPPHYDASVYNAPHDMSKPEIMERIKNNKKKILQKIKNIREEKKHTVVLQFPKIQTC